MPKHFGHYVRILHWCTDQRITNALAQMELTASQGPILGYIAHRKTPPCPRDIEEEFRLSHPTVSGLLSRLEKKGFLEFFPDQTDRRCKRIRLQEKGRQCIEIMHRTIAENETNMMQGFSEAEQELFFTFLNRAIQNMGGNPCCRKSEEDATT
ncbi:MAG: MarR family transcriptional regulator [Oscillospiraceae bacterium]|nr:MarR family transcriptional regulator [Oscillospiraceae bacterium]